MKTARDSERGAAAVVVAILMVVLLGFAAIAVDVGLLYSEKAQLQSGADAGALGIAQACAKGESGCSSPSSLSLAKGLADANSLDGQSNVQSIDLDTINRKVTVTANPLEAGRSDNRVSLYFASVLGIPSSSVVAKSSAVWGSPRKGPIVFPMAISVCQVRYMVGGSIQLIRSHTAKSDPHAPCPEGPAGKDAPGGFGWLATPAGSCNLSVDLGSPLGGTDPVIDAKTGNEAPAACKATLDGWVAELQAGREVIVLLPVFNAVEGTGANTKYSIISFAALSVKGWKFDGDGILPWTFRNNAAGTKTCEKECRGIIGQFVKHVALASSYEELGPVSLDGVTAVKLTN